MSWLVSGIYHTMVFTVSVVSLPYCVLFVGCKEDWHTRAAITSTYCCYSRYTSGCAEQSEQRYGMMQGLLAVLLFMLPPFAVCISWVFGTAHPLRIHLEVQCKASQKDKGTPIEIVYNSPGRVVLTCRLLACSGWLMIFVGPLCALLIVSHLAYQVCHRSSYLPSWSRVIDCTSSSTSSFHYGLLVFTFLPLQSPSSYLIMSQQPATYNEAKMPAVRSSWTKACRQRIWRFKIFLLAQVLPTWALLCIVGPLTYITNDILDLHGKFSGSLIAGILIIIPSIAIPTFLISPFAFLPNAAAFISAAMPAASDYDADIELAGAADYIPLLEGTTQPAAPSAST